MLVSYAGQMARHGTLLQSASTPELPVLRSSLLRRMDKRPSLWSAGTVGHRHHGATQVQTTNRAAVYGGVALIREMRPFEEPHAFAL
jgi:hypothetical protein